MGDGQVTPEQDTVAFGSVLHGLGFNVKRYAKIDASKMSVNKVKMIKHFNGKTKRPAAETLGPAAAMFQFFMGPIAQVMSALNVDREKHIKMMESLKIVLKGYEKQF